MAVNFEDLLSTPTGYATPEQISSAQQMADLLSRQSVTDTPITNKWQGPQKLVEALAGNVMRNRAAQQQMQNAAILGGRQAGAEREGYGLPMGGTPGIGQSSDIGLPQPGAPAANQGVASVRNNNPGAQWPGPVANQFGATGFQTIGGGNKIATFPDPISGAAAEFALLEKNYSGMPLGAAIQKWSGGNNSPAYAAFIAKRTGLPPNTVITPQLLRSPQGVALTSAIADWEAGGRSPLGPNEWSQAQQRAFGGGGRPMPPQPGIAGQSADLSGSIGGVSPPPAGSPAAMSAALSGGQQTAQATPQGQQMAAGPAPAAGRGPPAPGMAAPQYGPQYMPVRPRLSYETLRMLLQDPILDPAMKQMYIQRYEEQFQPITAPTFGGTAVAPGPGARPGPLQIIPQVQTMETEGGEGTKYQTPFDYEMTPQGPVRRIIPTLGTYPGQPQTPPKEETPGPKFNIPKDKPQSQNVPAGTPGQNVPPTGTAQTGQTAPLNGPAQPVRVASLGNTPLPSNMLTQAPPGATGAAPQASAPKGAQTAQYMDPYSKGTIQELQTLGAEGAAKKKSATADVDMFNESYKGTQNAAVTSRSNIDSLKLAQKLAGAPGFPAGLFAEGRLDLQKLQAWLGDNPKAGKEAQEFDKIMAAQGVDQLRTIWAGAGLGQVRLAEFQTIMKSLASRANTPEAIQSLIGMMIKAHERVGEVGELQNWFRKGYRYDDEGNFTKPPGAVPPSNIVDWYTTLEKYIKANPIIAPEDIENFNKKYGSTETEPEQTTYTNTGTGQPTPTTQPTPQDDPLQRAIEERTRRGR